MDLPLMIRDAIMSEVRINEAAVNRKAREIRFKASTLEGNNRIAWLLKAIGFIDLTTLGGDDTATNVNALCQKAARPIIPCNPGQPIAETVRTAAICVYPSRIDDAVKALQKYDPETEVSIASVAGGFPSGQYPLESRLKEVQLAILSGANEIDVVIDRCLALSHHWIDLYKELKAMRDVCSSQAHMKTILATGELFDLKDVYKASMIAMLAGSDFIKTSTGKEAVNATLPVGIVMCRAIKDYYNETNKKVGFKPAGGIQTAQDALEWMVLIKTELGQEWLTKDLFRIGASSLLDNIKADINALSKLYL